MRWRCNENAIEMIMTLVIVMVSVETTIIDISDNDHNYGGERNIPPPSHRGIVINPNTSIPSPFYLKKKKNFRFKSLTF